MEERLPCKQQVTGSRPVVSTGVWPSLVRAPALGAGSRWFESSHPDSDGSLAETDQHSPEKRERQARYLRGPPCRTNTMASVSAFQAENAGSIPACGSRRR